MVDRNYQVRQQFGPQGFTNWASIYTFDYARLGLQCQ